jgi:predicted nuclease with TOPRIM domain
LDQAKKDNDTLQSQVDDLQSQVNDFQSQVNDLEVESIDLQHELDIANIKIKGHQRAIKNLLGLDNLEEFYDMDSEDNHTEYDDQEDCSPTNDPAV